VIGSRKQKRRAVEVRRLSRDDVRYGKRNRGKR
jgi:hypothetical protein